MKKLLYKEMKLSANPLSYWFIGFSAMTMIPRYPILVGSSFICLGIFHTYQQIREYDDITPAPPRGMITSNRPLSPIMPSTACRSGLSTKEIGRAHV